MTRLTTHLGRTARRPALLALPLFVATTGTAAAYGGGSTGGGTMGGWGLFGGTMGLWGLLWMGLLVAVPLYLVITLARRRDGGTDDRSLGEDRSLGVLRERYARGDLSEDEFERRRERLDRTG